MAATLSRISRVTPQVLASARLAVRTPGPGLIDVTGDVVNFLKEIAARDGVLLMFLRHTSASLTIQENADPDVRRDLVTALDQLAPQDAGWVHDSEGPDDMPAHVKAMLTGVTLNVPVAAGTLKLGTWQGIYLVEHRRAPHDREIVLQFLGACA